MSLFAKAKKSAVKKETGKNTKDVRILVSDSEFYKKVQELETLNDNMKRDKAKADMISDEIKDLGKEKWSEMYDKTGRNPGSVFLESRIGEDTAQVMFVPSDKYITINEARAEELKDEYGDDIVEEKNTFSFDNDMVEKYGEIISRLIEECEDIEEGDKGRIIKAEVKYSVAKGTIDKLNDYGVVSEIMEVVRPVIALKNVEVVRG